MIVTLQDLIPIITSVTASGVFTGIALWLSREWLSTRLKGSIQHEYNQKLEEHKAQLKAQNELALLELKMTIERETALHIAARASFAEGQKAAMERKLEAIDRVWATHLTLRARLPGILIAVDGMTVDQYRHVKNHPGIQGLVGKLSQEEFVSLFSDANGHIERVRPYVGDWMWALFFCYQAIMTRRLYVLYFTQDDTATIEWHKDEGTRQLITVTLTSDEMQEFDHTLDGKWVWLQRKIESKILASARRIISGEAFGTESLEQARLIQQRAAELHNESTMP